MSFANKLTGLMYELGISQTRLHELTGIGKSSISQYVSGKNEPSQARKREIAVALGVQEDYFNEYLPAVKIQSDYSYNLPIPVAAKLLHKSIEWVRQGLRDGVFPWGWAVKMKDWSYYISPIKFTEYTGIQIPKEQKDNDESENEKDDSATGSECD